MNLEQAQKIVELEDKLNEAHLVFIRCDYKYSCFYDDSTAYTCSVYGTEDWDLESMDRESRINALLSIKEDNEEDMEELNNLHISFNPAQADSDGDEFDIPTLDIVNGIYEIDVIK